MASVNSASLALDAARSAFARWFSSLFRLVIVVGAHTLRRTRRSAALCCAAPKALGPSPLVCWMTASWPFCWDVPLMLHHWASYIVLWSMHTFAYLYGVPAGNLSTTILDNKSIF